MSGIGFLDAGMILFRQDKIRGLTTAASLWTVAAIGLEVGGGGLYVAALGGTEIIFAILAGLKPLGRWSGASGPRVGCRIAEQEEKQAGSTLRTPTALSKW